MIPRETIRVLHFTRVINRNDFIDTIIRFADPSRFSMMACTLEGARATDPPDYTAFGIPHAVLPGARRSQYVRTIVGLATLLRRHRIDVLHTHHYEETVLGVLAARLVQSTSVVIGRHYHDELYLMTAGLKLHGMLAIERLCVRQARGVIVPSTQIRDLLTVRQGMRPEKVWLVPYGFDFAASRYRRATEVEATEARRSLGLAGEFVIGNFARHYRLKGQDDLLVSFEKLVRDCPEARLLMVGDGPEHGRLRAMVADRGLARQVRFTGWRPDVPRLMDAVDVVAHPTLQEAFPQVMVEALAKAKPLVISGISGSLDHVQHERTGLLVPPRDPEALHAALRWVHDHPAEARRLGAQGRAYVLARLDIRDGVKAYEACYQRALR